MPINTMLYFGNFTQADTNESNYVSEISNHFTGTYTKSTGLALVGLSTSVPYTSPAYDDDTALPGSGADWSYNIGAGTVTTVQDTTETWTATVTYGNGTSEVLTLVVVQMTNGDAFIRSTADLDGKVIKTVQLTSMQSSSWAGVYNTSGIENSSVIVCFVRGTKISTPNGPQMVQNISVGDEITTRDHGPQKVTWIGSTKVAGIGNLAPIRFKKGAIGNERSLWVSPQHRIVIQNWKAAVLFDREEVLVTAKSLINGDDIEAVDVDEVEYFHILFDRHQIIESEGVWTESLHPGDQSLRGMARESQLEILALFPEILEKQSGYGAMALKCLSHSETQVLTAF